MRKTLFAAILLSSLAFAATSQAQLRIGVRAGANLASQARDNAGTLSSHVGFVGGADMQYWFSSMLALNPQLLFAQRGVHEETTVHNAVNNGSAAPVSRDWTLNYLEIPILLRMNLSDGAYRPYIFAGPVIGLLMSGSVTTTPTGEGANSNLNSTNDLNSSDFNSPDFGLLFGAGVSYKMVYGPAFTLDAGYGMGLSSAAKSGTLQTNSTTSADAVDLKALNMRQRDIRISLGISFQMGDARDLW